jgi:glucosamine-6-phosphate deaminase
METQSQAQSYQSISEQTALAIKELLQAKPNCCLGLPSGHTPLLTYKILSTWSQEGKIDWSQARCFALDDYLETEARHTFQAFLEENLYCYTNVAGQHKFNPSRVDDYDGLIASQGGLDLTILGIGNNGHVAFNEPGINPQSWTHCTWLAESTRIANEGTFGGIDKTPRRGITMGLKTIMASKQIILLASGEKKKIIVERAFSGTVTNQVPASLLQAHEALKVWTDFSWN